MRRLISLIMVGLLATAAVGCDNAAKTGDKAKAEEPATNNNKAEAGTNNKQAEAPKEEATSDEPVLFATGPVAKLNGKEITAEAFNKEIEKLKNVTSRIPASALPKFKDSTLTRLIDQTLVEAEIDKQNITATDDDVQKEWADFEKSIGGPSGVERFYQQTGMTEAEVKSDMKRAVQLEKLLKDKYKIAVDDKKAKEFYDTNIQRFTQEEQVRASHILIKVAKDAPPETVKEKKKAAKDIFNKAKKKDADFAALAREFSEGPTASKGGDLGFFTRKRMVPSFSEAAFKTKVGNVTGPVRSDFGFHVIKVFEKKDANVTKFAEVKEEIVRNLERQEMRDSTKKLIDELRKDAKIEKMAANIKENPKAAPASMPHGLPPGLNIQQMKGKQAPAAPAPKPTTPPAPKGK